MRTDRGVEGVVVGEQEGLGRLDNDAEGLKDRLQRRKDVFRTIIEAADSMGEEGGSK